MSLASGTLTVNGALSGVTTLATSGNATIGGNLTVTGNTLTFGNGEIVNNVGDGILTFNAASYVFSGLGKGVASDITIRANTNYDSQVVFAEGAVMGIKWSIGNDATNDKLTIDSGTTNVGTATKLSLDSSGNMEIAGNLTVTSNFACNGQTAAAPPDWTVSNKTGTSRALDANGSLADIGDRLSQLVDDLISIGILQ